MVLECVVKYNNGTKFSSDLPSKIAEKFNHIKQFGICGFDITKCQNHHYISFRGKSYSNIIQKITEKSLYHDLEFNQLEKMHLKLEETLDNFEEFYEIENVQKSYANTYNLIFWAEHLSEQHIPSPYEIIGLKEIFKICYENKLQLYACD